MRKFNPSSTQTNFIELNTKSCEACWKCLEVCPKGVFGKINILWHKHVKVANADSCIGCLKCVKACQAGAISKIFIK